MAKAFAGVKPEQLDFDAVETEDSKLMKHIEDWPAWVQTGLGFVKRVLAVVGIDVDFADIKDPAEYLDELTALVKKSPSLSPYKWIALAALTWLRKRVESDAGLFARAFGSA